MDFLPSPAQLEDWLVARWTLLHIDSLRDAAPEKASALEALFTPETVRGLVDRASPDALLLLFRVLSAQALRPLCDELFELWPKAPRVLGWHIAERLAEIAPERLESRLAEWLEAHPLENELLSLTSLAGTLTALPPGHGAELAGKLADFALGFEDVYLLDLLRPELIELGRRHALPQTLRLLEGLFEPGHVNRYLHTDALLHGYEALTGGQPYYDLFLRRARGETEQGIEPLAPLFLPEAPLGAIQAAFLQGPQVALDQLDALLPPAPNAMSSLARTLLERGRSFGEVPSRDASSVFLSALSCAAWAREKPDWAALSAAQIAGLGVADLASLPDAEGALERLRGLPRADVCASLEAALLENEESRGAATLVSWMGQLRYGELLQPLRASLDSSLNDGLADAAAKALRCFGAAAEADLVARWEDLTEAQQEYGAGLLALCGGEATVGLLISRRADLHQDEARKLWTRMAWSLPDARLAEVLEEELEEDWDAPEMEESYLMQCLLLERAGRHLDEIRDTVVQQVFPDDDDEEDDFDLPPPPPLFVELRCTGCGTEAEYENPKIYVDFDHPAERPVVAGGLECTECGEAEGLQPTADGLETLRQRCEEIVLKGEAGRSLHELPIQLMDGRRVSIGAALSTYEQALERRPGSAVDLFMLARCSHSAGYGRKALQLFRECLASEPAYVQAALDLAHLLESGHSAEPALEVLDEAVRHKGRWQLFRTVDFPTEADLKRAFVGLYNSLREAAQDDSRRALHVSDLQTVKAGRNDPCPCGSGKKYKKCCWLKEQ